MYPSVHNAPLATLVFVRIVKTNHDTSQWVIPSTSLIGVYFSTKEIAWSATFLPCC